MIMVGLGGWKVFRFLRKNGEGKTPFGPGKDEGYR